ncbi:hypothetical protein GDO86_010629 [Hymenochirus boettgeri]|uniref:Taste receptor type 2 n=1 Tax=Hymenochirus boettgeri TaxID=247094 RepID=A0A8T2JKW7_9PIPI|nr:hypothetical protein GDO86_010629 [Hymenochirus boettgeri]
MKTLHILIGILFNTFILAMTVIWWIQSKHLETIDIILSSLGLTRLAVLITLVIRNVYLPNVLKHEETFFISIVFVTCCSQCFGTVLCVFYCVKISNYSNSFFMYMKSKISKMVPWLLLGSVIFSFMFSLMVNCIAEKVIPNNSINGTEDGSIEMTIQNFILYMAGPCLPFFLFCVSISLLIRSLFLHIRSMAGDGSWFANPQIQVHINAIKTMVSFLIFYMVFFASSFLINIVFQEHILQAVFQLLAGSYPSLHSVILVMSNRRFKETLLRFLSCAI